MTRLGFLVSLFNLLLLVLVPADSVSETDPNLYTVTRVSDGDGIHVRASTSATFKVRLLCIDAPELAQGRAGLESRDALARILPVGAQVRLQRPPLGKKSYDRVLAHVFPLNSDKSASELMVEQGQAFVYCFFLDEGCPIASLWYNAEKRARAACLGVWKESPNGLQPRPWDFRYIAKNNGRLPPWKDSCPALLTISLKCATKGPTLGDDAASVQETAPDFGDDPTDDSRGDGEVRGAAGSPPPQPMGSGLCFALIFVSLIVGMGAFPVIRYALEMWRATHPRTWQGAETAMLTGGGGDTA